MIEHPIAAGDRRRLEMIPDALDDFSGAYIYLKDFLSRDQSSEALVAVYEALRSVTYRMLMRQWKGTEIDLWCDVVLRLYQIIAQRDLMLAERLIVLSDLLEQASRAEMFGLSDRQT